MPWKDVNGTSFYYRSIREGGRVRSEYVGSGPMAEMVEATDKYLASRRRADRLAALAEFEAFREGESRLGLAEFVAMVETVYRALMAAAGYHRHDRGKWRRVRMSEIAVSEAAQTPAVQASKPTPHQKYGIHTQEDFERIVPGWEEIEDIFARASKGDKAVLPKLRMLLDIDEDGTLAKLQHADSGAQLQWVLVQKAAGDNLALRESLRFETDRIREMMEGEDPTPSERLLADRVALTWLNLRRYELTFELREHTFNTKLREEYHRQIARWNRDHLAAIQALATVRKLALPVLQFQLNMNSIAEQKMIAKVGRSTPRNRGEQE